MGVKPETLDFKTDFISYNYQLYKIEKITDNDKSIIPRQSFSRRHGKKYI